MKKFFIISIVFICFGIDALFIRGDTYIKIIHHSDGYYNYGNNIPEGDLTVEYWIGEKKMASVTDRGKLVLDLTGKFICVVDNSTKTYVKIPFSTQISNIVTERVKSYFRADETGGTVQATGKIKKIGEWNCKGYEIKFWVADQKTLYEERIEKIWTTSEVLFNPNIYYYFNSILYNAYQHVMHWDENLINDLKKIRGFPMVRDIKLYIKGNPRKAKRAVVEMSVKPPSARIFSIPADFKKKDKLTVNLVYSLILHGDWGIIN